VGKVRLAEKKKTPRHQFVARIPEDLFRRIQKKSFDLDMSQNFLIIECIRQSYESEPPEKRHRKPERSARKNSGAMIIRKPERRNYRSEQSVSLLISEELLVQVTETAEKTGISPDRMISECIKKSRDREINSMIKQKEYYRKKKEKKREMK